jgi:phage portal protein BeeE
LFYVSEIDGNLEAFAASNILHIEQMSINGMADCQLVYKARESFALALAAEEFASKYFRYGGRIGGILEVPAGMTKN